MDIVNESGLQTAWLVSKIEPPAFSLTVVVKGTFNLIQDGTAQQAEEQLLPMGDEFEDGDRSKPLRYPMDFAPFKPRADLLLVGSCYAPEGQPVGSLQISLRVGHFLKSLLVTGDRRWEELGGASEPTSFTSMTLGWDRAFGGSGFHRNPLGKGSKEIIQEDGSIILPLPNVESLAGFVSNSGQCVEPAGFGPIPDGWPQRLRKFGKINKRYLKERWPWYPENMDWGFFNAAPEDQQIESYLRGDEEIAFDHLHPANSCFRSRLPGMRVRCFLNELVRAREELREVPLRLDTLWVQPDAEQLVLVWRGHANVRTEKLLEIRHMLVTTEPLDSSPVAVEYFAGVLRDAILRREGEDEEFEEEEKPEEHVELEIEELEEVEEPEEEEFEPVAEARISPATALADDEPEPSEPEEEETDEEEPVDQDDPLTLEQVRDKLARRDSFEGCDLSCLILAGLDFGGLNLREVILEGAVLIRANLAQADLTGAVLANADLREANCAGAVFIEADLTEALLSQADLAGADLRAADFSKARLRQGNLCGVRASDAIFEEALIKLTPEKSLSVRLQPERLTPFNSQPARLHD